MSLLYIYNENSGILFYRKRSAKDKDKLMYKSKSNCWHLAAGKVAQRFFLKLFQFNKLIQPGAKLVFIASDSFWMLFLLQQEEHYQKCHQSRFENWLKLLWKRKNNHWCYNTLLICIELCEGRTKYRGKGQKYIKGGEQDRILINWPHNKKYAGIVGCRNQKSKTKNPHRIVNS